MANQRSHGDDHGKDAAATTKVLTNPSEIERTLVQVFSNIQHTHDIVNDSTGVTVAIGVELIKKLLTETRNRGIKIRFITEITKDNLSYCKELMQIVTELRHFDGVCGNFGVSESEYLAVSSVQKEKPLSILIYSNVKEIVRQEQFLFNTLWNQAIPAKQRIKEIENDRKEEEEHEFLQVCSDHKKAAQVYSEFAGVVQKEALLILPNSKALQRQYKLGVLHKLVDAAVKRKATIKIICPLDEQNAEIAKWLLSNNSNNDGYSSGSGSSLIQLLNGDNSKSTIFVVDDMLAFRAELRNQEAEEFHDAIGYAIYSNSKPTINSFKSFFEMLWNSRTLAEKLREADRVQREFINVAAHELRNPIQPILGALELLELDAQESELQEAKITKEELEILVRNAKRLEQLSSDILQLARIESNNLVLNKEPFNLNEEIQNVIRDIQGRIVIVTSTDATTSSSSPQLQIQGINKKKKNIQIKFEPKTDPIIVQIDKTKIFEVISNLLTNAIKFTDDSGTILITSEIAENDNDDIKEKEEALVKVKDTGKGIDPEIIPRLFTKFATKSEQGTGLGLCISKAIIEAHGGRIWAENNNSEGKGATFYFTLPIYTTSHNASDQPVNTKTS